MGRFRADQRAAAPVGKHDAVAAAEATTAGEIYCVLAPAVSDYRETPLAWDDPGTYVETDQTLTATLSHEWNHGMGEIISALLTHGLQITGLVEHQSIPWEALPGQMVCDDRGEFRLEHAPWRLPLSYTLQAIKA